MGGSRVQFFEHYLAVLQYHMAHKAFHLVQKEMCKEKGFSRLNGTHYYFHLVDVAQKLLNAGVREEDVITAALLHDLVEDVLDENNKPVYSIEDIEKLFNKNVATMVALLTKDPSIDYKTNKDALVQYLARISKNYGAALIKCADRQNNLFTLKEASPEKIIRTILETEEYYIPFFKTCRNLYPWYAAFFFDAKTTIEPYIWFVKSNYEKIDGLQQENDHLKQQKK